jgi:hypothetical protein
MRLTAIVLAGSALFLLGLYIGRQGGLTRWEDQYPDSQDDTYLAALLRREMQ